MNKYAKLIIFIIAFAISFNFQTYSSILGNREIKTVSDKKIVQIEKIVERTLAQNVQSNNYDAIKLAMEDEVNTVFSIKKGTAILKIDFKKIEKEADEYTAKKYVLNQKQLREKYNKEADIKFIPAKIGSKVTVIYHMGHDKLVRAAGIYRGLTRWHRGIIIDDTRTVPYRKPVAFYDMVPEDKWKYDRQFREITKQKYIDDNVKKYLKEKEAYRVIYIKNKIDQIGKDNEEAGYIYAWHEWRTPITIADMIYKYHLVKIMRKNKEIAEIQNSSETNSKTSAEKNSQKTKQNTETLQMNNLKQNIKNKAGALNEVMQALE
jgi:hypothetical protein